jgi:ribosomal-protein-alanine N-acetyltransferase
LNMTPKAPAPSDKPARERENKPGKEWFGQSSPVRNCPDSLSDIEFLPLADVSTEDLAFVERSCFTDPWMAHQLHSERENPLAFYRVACRKGCAVGYAGMHSVLDEGSVTRIAVLPEFRRLRIGEALLFCLIREARARNLSTLTLEVRESSFPARSLYEKLGFRQVGYRAGYYSDPVEGAVLMTRFFASGSAPTP